MANLKEHALVILMNWTPVFAILHLNFRIHQWLDLCRTVFNQAEVGV